MQKETASFSFGQLGQDIGSILRKPIDPIGTVIGVFLIVLWFYTVYQFLIWDFSYFHISTLLAVLLQTQLYTGLFITSHDAMHGIVSKNKKVNYVIGWITSFLFAFNSYDRLLKSHHDHHRHVASDHDPDYHVSGNFWLWYGSFIKRYLTLKQWILNTIAFNVLMIWFPMENLLIFWILPGLLSTFQLFYFGTYIPHKGGHHQPNKHNAQSQKKNHLWAFISCYFFGYHYEHHDAPGVPWWRLWQVKELQGDIK